MGFSGAEHSACWLMLEPWGTGFANLLQGTGVVIFHPPQGSWTPSLAVQGTYQPSVPAPLSHTGNSKISAGSLIFRLVGVKLVLPFMGHSEKRTLNASESTLSSVIAVSTEMLISEKNKNTPVSSDSFLQGLKNPVKYQSRFSPVCANLALQGNFWHMCVTNQTHSH